MKYGILACGFECDEYIDQVLPPWLEVKKENKDDQFVFSCVYGQFKEYADFFGKKDISKPDWANKYSELIDNFVLAETPDTEANNRNLALNYLLQQKCDIIWLLDIQDEIYTIKNINNIINFVKSDGYSCWYSVSLKNYVFDDKTYILDPFTPPRIFRANFNGFKLNKFTFDNDPVYVDVKNQDIPGIDYSFDSTRYISYKQFVNTNIPQQCALIRHMTWLSNEKSKNKVKYQLSHFNGNCSYKWNEKENKLEFDEFFYMRNGQFLPFLGHD